MRLHESGDAMIGRETRMLLRHYLEQGTSKSALARRLGVHRDTIHRWIRDGDLDRDLDATPVRYGPRRAVPTKLDDYKAIIETRLAAYPALSAVRLLAGMRAAGPSSTACGAGHPLRDAGGPPGASRLRGVPLPLGQTVRPARRARLLT